jgi:hypothetical protein
MKHESSKKISNGKERGKKKKRVFASSDSIAKRALSLSLSLTHTAYHAIGRYGTLVLTNLCLA